MSVLRLIPACKDYIWGGTKLAERYNKPLTGGRLAESWELSCHPDGESVIGNGEYSARTLAEYLRENPSALGKNCPERELPILIKLIDARENLSVQVHPTDAFAREHGLSRGKTELWYVLEAEPGASLYCGLRESVTRERLRESVESGTLTELLNAVPVRPGDTVFIPAGTIHAIRGGVVVAEVQQSSNLTYRMYDYGRLGADGKPRALHIEKALAAARLEKYAPAVFPGEHLASCEYFTVDRADAPFAGFCGDESFLSVIVIDGGGELRLGEEALSCRKGDSLFLPAGSGELSLSGEISALLTRAGACQTLAREG